jgi:hypothetical protein
VRLIGNTREHKMVIYELKQYLPITRKYATLFACARCKWEYENAIGFELLESRIVHNHVCEFCLIREAFNNEEKKS